MSLLRTATLSLSRAGARSAAPSTFVMATRGYADGPTPTAGSTASAKGFKEREQSQEAQYVRKAEQEKLAKLRESIKKQREHLDEVEKNIENLNKQ
ncbi:uncharacterized protein PFL1_01813 [Pseudozyma flocculosa PF-1]|uniref:ATPase inhibitor, mitochondrial n=1 Tax=Pseudozyma flocculosa TaxID=84751 RepID=A0A5C3EXU4_9BASI|nr:uncharacterized protein PFL1_01813 [Pseudozyma flocculosa PF-1]EPQ30915.1 hypothetical protein PFL1_01813 [Pseudozyma flocculosa PF-1]SPO36700.1 related to ATPase inhibitor, mitochondrial precursor [Pseudozyma flocculosa]